MAFEGAEHFLKSRRRHSVSCMIADVQMPGMTGLELHDRLVASGEPIPTILITAFPDERARERALQAGVIGYLSKPFSEDELLACISPTAAPRCARAGSACILPSSFNCASDHSLPAFTPHGSPTASTPRAIPALEELIRERLDRSNGPGRC
jgi:CheY-like chemotaxis protein